jgi:hypothetical protein
MGHEIAAPPEKATDVRINIPPTVTKKKESSGSWCQYIPLVGSTARHAVEFGSKLIDAKPFRLLGALKVANLGFIKFNGKTTAKAELLVHAVTVGDHKLTALTWSRLASGLAMDVSNAVVGTIGLLEAFGKTGLATPLWVKSALTITRFGTVYFEGSVHKQGSDLLKKLDTFESDEKAITWLIEQRKDSEQWLRIEMGDEAFEELETPTTNTVHRVRQLIGREQTSRKVEIFYAAAGLLSLAATLVAPDYTLIPGLLTGATVVAELYNLYLNSQPLEEAPEKLL